MIDANKKLKHQSVMVGDGITINLYSDSHAYTVIKRTPKTITIQRDKATLDPNYQPEFVIGGFAAHCINMHDQAWIYEKDPKGHTMTLHWSDKLGGWKTPYKNLAIIGRHEFYDYNF